MQCKQSAHLSSEYQEKKQHNYHRHYKSKWDHRRRKLVHEDKIRSSETKSVTQEMNVETNGLTHIISTTLCNDKKNVAKSCDKNGLKNSKVQRFAPHCLRRSCHVRHGTCRHKTGLLNHEKKKYGAMKCMDHERRNSRHDKQHGKEKFCHNRNMSKLDDHPEMNPYYDDISITSINKYMEIPISYKHVTKRNDGENYESKLDNLIKRTKERERKLVEQSRGTAQLIQWYTSTPAHTDACLSEFQMSCSDIASLHSRSTMVLDTKDHGYSRSIYSPRKMEIPRIYIEDNISKYRELNFYIKEEPLDIQVYSPTNRETAQHRVKQEIKIEPTV